VNFLAEVWYIDDFYCQCISDQWLAEGDTLWGHYTYETTAPDEDPSHYYGKYYYTESPYGIIVYHKNYTFASDSVDVDFRIYLEDSVTTYGLRDLYVAQSLHNEPDPIAGPSPLAGIQIRLEDRTGTALSSDSLPSTAPELSDWTYSSEVIIYGTGVYYSIFGQLLWIGTGEPPIGVARQVPIADALGQSYPNPFNPSTTIPYTIAKDTNVDLSIFDVKGARVRTLERGWREADVYTTAWDGLDDRGNAVASGIYFYRLIAGDFEATRKMVLIR